LIDPTCTQANPNLYQPGKRPFQTIIPGFAGKAGKPWMSFGVMGGDMQPQGQAQIRPMGPSDGSFGRYECIEHRMSGATSVYAAASEMRADAVAIAY
jgi:hypothetical protein